MTTQRRMVRLQKVLFAGAVALVVLHWIGHRTLGRQAAELDQPLTNSVRQLNLVLERNPLFQGLDTAGREERLRSVEIAADNLKAATQLARQRSETDPALRALLNEPFQLIDFDNARAQMIAELRRLAATKKVTVAPGVFSGYPDFVGGLSDPSQLWAQLTIANQAVLTAVLQQPRLVSAADSLPVRTHLADANSVAAQEFSVRLELFGSMDSVQGFLLSLPLRGEEFGQLDCPQPPVARQALFVDRFLMRNVTNRPGEVYLDVVISGFVPAEAQQALNPQ